MLVSAVTNVSNKNNGFGLKNSQSGTVNYDRNNYFGSKDNTQNRATQEDMFHRIALWKEFCERKIVTDESQIETFNYLA